MAAQFTSKNKHIPWNHLRIGKAPHPLLQRYALVELVETFAAAE